MGLWNNKVRVANFEISYQKEFGKNSAYTKESLERLIRAQEIGNKIVCVMNNMVRDPIAVEDWCDNLVIITSIEGYSFASRGRAIVHMGEFGGIIRTAIMDRAFGGTIFEVAPGSWRKSIVGKGNASKEAMIPIYEELVGSSQDVSSDVIDAFALSLYSLVENGYLEGYNEWRDKFVAKGGLVQETKERRRKPRKPCKSSKGKRKQAS